MIVSFVFAIALFLILGPYWALVLRPEVQEDRALRGRLKARKKVPRLSRIANDAGKLSSVEFVDGALNRWRSVVSPLEHLIKSSGLQLTLGTVILASGFVASTTFLAVSLLASSTLLALVLGLAAGFLPVMYVQRSVRKRIETFEEQFPEAIDLIARGLRAGHALTTTLQMVGDEIPDPVGGEFRLLFEQQNLQEAQKSGDPKQTAEPRHIREEKDGYRKK